MKENIDFWTDVYAVSIGVMGAVLKGIKKRLGMKTLLIQASIGAVLAYGTIGIIDQFFGGLNEKVVIVISFAVGWAANEITEYLDDAVKVYADKLTDKLTKK